jgi:hypothetical protein
MGGSSTIHMSSDASASSDWAVRDWSLSTLEDSEKTLEVMTPARWTNEGGEAGRTGTGDGEVSSSSCVAAGEAATAAVAASVVALSWRTQTSNLSSAVEANITPSDSKRECGWPTALLLSEVAPAALVARERTRRKAKEREDGRFWSEAAVATEDRSIPIDAMIRQLAHTLLWLARATCAALAHAPTRAPPTAIRRSRYGVFGCKREKLNEWELLITVTVTQKKNTTRDAGHVVTRSLSLNKGLWGRPNRLEVLLAVHNRPHG